MREPFHQLYFHLVWATYDRLPLLLPQYETRLFSCVVAKTEDMGCKVVALDGLEDHIHLLVRGRPSVAVASLVKEVKGASSHLMNQEIAPLDTFRWQGAYGAFSVSPRAVPKVKDYVFNQKTRHYVGDLQEDWECCFLEENETF